VQGEKFSPVFLGVPTAPTPDITVSNTQIATTRFVTNWTNALPTMSQQNANAVNITGGSISGITPLALVDGGTGSGTAAGARAGLQLGNIAVMNTSNIAFDGGTMSGIIITGGTVSGLSAPVPVASGGTGSANAAGARLNLGLGSISTQNSNAVGITGGTLTGITVLNASGVNITSGTISGITDLGVADGGTGASDAANARVNLGAAASATTVTVGAGLTGNGTLGNNIAIAFAANSNGYGTRYVSTTAPTGGSDGDIWYQI
jgi:hypothetical protein